MQTTKEKVFNILQSSLKVAIETINFVGNYVFQCSQSVLNTLDCNADNWSSKHQLTWSNYLCPT